MTERRLSAFLFIVFCLSGCTDPPSPAGIALEAKIPAGWRYVSHSAVAASGARLHFDAAALDRALASNHATPLFALTSAAPQPAAVGATLGISVQRGAAIEATTPQAMLAARINSAAGGVKPDGDISSGKLAGHAAARATLNDQAGQELRVTVLFVDDTAFTIAASLEASDRTQSDAIDQFLASLRVTQTSQGGAD